MNRKRANIGSITKKHLIILLVLQFIGASSITYTGLTDKECCHTQKVKECCMMDEVSPFHCSTESEAALGFSHCGCSHDKDAIDSFIVSERIVTTNALVVDIPQFNMNTSGNNYGNFGYELKFLPSEIPKYISNASFLI